MCETLPGPRIQSGIEFIELPGHGLNDAWLFVVIASIVGVILLITVVTFTFIKCREYVLIYYLLCMCVCVCVWATTTLTTRTNLITSA